MRSMLVAILYKLENTFKVTAVNAFNDVAGGTWYTDAVIWASENNIVSGYGNGKFGPSDRITREQMALILMNYAKVKNYGISKSGELTSFKDALKTSNWS